MRQITFAECIQPKKCALTAVSIAVMDTFTSQKYFLFSYGVYNQSHKSGRHLTCCVRTSLKFHLTHWKLSYSPQWAGCLWNKEKPVCFKIRIHVIIVSRKYNNLHIVHQQVSYTTYLLPPCTQLSHGVQQQLLRDSYSSQWCLETQV